GGEERHVGLLAAAPARAALARGGDPAGLGGGALRALRRDHRGGPPPSRRSLLAGAHVLLPSLLAAVRPAGGRWRPLPARARPAAARRGLRARRGAVAEPADPRRHGILLPLLAGRARRRLLSRPRRGDRVPARPGGMARARGRQSGARAARAGRRGHARQPRRRDPRPLGGPDRRLLRPRRPHSHPLAGPEWRSTGMDGDRRVLRAARASSKGRGPPGQQATSKRAGGGRRRQRKGTSMGYI
ncbi:MAG: Uncharacterized protein MSMEG_2717, partial [uncultured Solirubrobacterales bacterium]